MSYWKTREGSRKLLATKRGENQTVEIVVTKIENRGTMTWQEFVEKLLSSFNEIWDINLVT